MQPLPEAPGAGTSARPLTERLRSLSPLAVLLYAAATLQFMRFYVLRTGLFIDLHRYIIGKERIPFQERVLPIAIMLPVSRWHYLMHKLSTHEGAFSPDRFAWFCISVVSFCVAGVYTQKLYRLLTPTGTLSILVYPLLLFAAFWSYAVQIDPNFAYPYDMPSLAFFTVGLYLIYTRKFGPLVALMFFATLNRETTLFLIGIYILDAATIDSADPSAPLRRRFSAGRVPWTRVAALLAVWLSVKLPLMYIFAHNDPTESRVRIVENLHRLQPSLIPSLLNLCGYLVVIVWLLRRHVRPIRFANYIYILPFWFAVMFYSGVLTETRIYGELCSYVAIASVLLLERHVLEQGRAPSDPPDVVPFRPARSGWTGSWHRNRESPRPLR